MKANRQSIMEQYILQNGEVDMRTLQDRFQVSLSTLRRDLAALEERGTVRKVYGGVQTVQPHFLTSFSERRPLNLEAKEQIGRWAAGLIKDGSTVYIDSGSTTGCVMPNIKECGKLTVVTNSLTALESARTLKGANIITPGGVYNSSLDSFMDAAALEKLRKFSFDVAVMAATGVSIEHGLSNTTYLEAQIKQVAVQKSRRILLLCDHTKLERNAPMQYCPLEEIDMLITDRRPPEKYMRFFSRFSIGVVYDEETAKEALHAMG